MLARAGACWRVRVAIGGRNEQPLIGYGIGSGIVWDGVWDEVWDGVSVIDGVRVGPPAKWLAPTPPLPSTLASRDGLLAPRAPPRGPGAARHAARLPG